MTINPMMSILKSTVKKLLRNTSQNTSRSTVDLNMYVLKPKHVEISRNEAMFYLPEREKLVHNKARNIKEQTSHEQAKGKQNFKKSYRFY